MRRVNKILQHEYKTQIYSFGVARFCLNLGRKGNFLISSQVIDIPFNVLKA